MQLDNVVHIRGGISILIGSIQFTASCCTLCYVYGKNQLRFVRTVIWICLVKGVLVTLEGVCLTMLDPDLTLS